MIHAMRTGQTYTFTAPASGGCNKGSVAAQSSNTAVATVTISGSNVTVTAVGVGTCQITVAVPGGSTEVRTVQVSS